MAFKTILEPEDRLKMAELIAQMSAQGLLTTPNKKYLALKVGSGPNSNVVTMWKDRVSFFLSSSDLIAKAKAAGFDPKAAKASRACDKNKFRFFKLSLHDLQNNEGLFSEIVNESVKTILERRPHTNPNHVRSHSNSRKGHYA
jgi:hypothetical protein